jgi:thiol-disulfide isomerase/thioredoxin
MVKLRCRPLTLSLVLLWAAAALSQAGLPQTKPKAPAKAPAADPPVVDLKGFRAILDRHRGRPLVVSFWATWCEPCRDEYPLLNELARQYTPQGLVVLGISLDEDAEITLVRHFLARYKPVFPNYRIRPGNEEEFAKVVDPKWRGAIPATFFYSRDGRELAQLIGEHPRAEFERAIRAVLGTATPSGSPND